MSEQPADWELAKENIQPLKQGRKMAKLANCLQVRDEDTQKLLQEERQAFETEIRTYAGADPLDPWYRYICWVEQSYPKGGKEGNLHVLLEKCIQQFKESSAARADPRYLEVWLNYAAMSSNPVDVYDFMYKNGMCSQQAGLYDAWAFYLENQGNYKAADKIYSRGLDALVDREAKAGLELLRQQFQTRVVRRTKGEPIPAHELEEQEQRTALGRLQGAGRHGNKVGSLRVGSAKLGGPGTVPLAPGSGLTFKQPLKTNNSQPIQIFQDENAPPPSSSTIGRSGSIGGSRSSSTSSIPTRQDYKENELSASKWSQAKVGSKMVNIPLDKIGQYAPRPAFSVHQDEGPQPATGVAPHKLMPGTSNVLSARKADRHDDEAMMHCPVALFEPPDPTKRPMYCKDKVYQGATEFSFEELRAVRWRAREKERLEKEAIEAERQEVERRRADLERERTELEDKERRLREQEEAMARQMEEYRRMMAAAMAGAKTAEPKWQGTLALSADSYSISGTAVPSAESSLKYSLDDTNGLMAANPTGAKSRPSVNATPSPHGNKVGLCQPSPTVNTKEAMLMVQQLWSNASSIQPPPEKPAIPRFNILLDNEREEPSQPAPQSAAPMPFAIYCDEDAVDEQKKSQATAPKCRKARMAIFNQEDKENVFVNPEENQENVAPAGYTQPVYGARPKTGILRQAENVEWMPLDEQEKLLDEEEAEEQKQQPQLVSGKTLARPTIASNNMTLFVPDMADFERMASAASTPFTGKAFVPEEDENTCAVQIVYRNQQQEESGVFLPPRQPNDPVKSPLSPIVETSREFCKSSSSSSGVDTTHGVSTARGEHSKSHWGNTGASSHHFTSHHQTTASAAATSRTPGQSLGFSSTTASGYMGDKSSFCPSQPRPVRQEPAFVQRPPSVTEEEDQTGMFSDMLAEFKMNLQQPNSRSENPRMEASMQPSFMEANDRDCDEDQEMEDCLGIEKNKLTEAGSVGALYPPPSSRSLAFCMAAMPPELDQTGILPARSAATFLTATPGFHTTNVNKKPNLNLTEAATPGMSMIRGAVDGLPALNMTGAATPVVSVRGAAEGLPALNVTGGGASVGLHKNLATLKLTATPGLNRTGAALAPPSLDFSAASPGINLTAATGPSRGTWLDISSAVPGPLALNLTDVSKEPMQQEATTAAVGHRPQATQFPAIGTNVDPFSPDLHRQLLARLERPVNQRHGYVAMPAGARLPQVRVGALLPLSAADKFLVTALKGEGGYAKVFAASREDDTGLDSTIAGIDAVLKVQKPANEWEWYVCTELHERLRRSSYSALHLGFMSIPRNYAFADGGIFVSYHQEMGNLLDIINMVKAADMRTSIEPMAIYFLIEILSLVEALHSLHFIHADIKADNFLLQSHPWLDVNATSAEAMFSKTVTSLQLIDFGRAIDLELLPSNITFTQVVKTEGLKCCEMREGRPWREHIDYFGIAATAYLMLFGTYMEVIKTGDVWEVKGSFKRWWNTELWKQFFHHFLNIKDTDKDSLPSLAGWRKRLQEVFYTNIMWRELLNLKKRVFG